MKIAKTKLPLNDAVRVRSAEFWLHLGEPIQALLELQKLSRRAAEHPWVLRVLNKARRSVPV